MFQSIHWSLSSRIIIGLGIAFLCFAITAESQFLSLHTHLRKLLHHQAISPLNVGKTPNPELVELGRALMFDKELSGNRDISCATCHHPLMNSGDGLSVSIGTGGTGIGPLRQLGPDRSFIPRNAPDLFNRGAPLWRSMFWDSRVSGRMMIGLSTPVGPLLPGRLKSTLAAQAMFPVMSRDEMRGVRGDVDVFGEPNELALIDDLDVNSIWNAIMDRLLAIPEYVLLFNAAYPHIPSVDLGFEHAANGLAAFQIEAFTFDQSPWDRFVAGDNTALSDTALKGAILFFGDGGCSHCHRGNLLTDQHHHNIGIPPVGPGKAPDKPVDIGLGREVETRSARYAFRTPPLRNVALTGPYMHNGAYSTLEGAVRHHLNPIWSLLNYDPSHLSSELREMYEETFVSDPTDPNRLMNTTDDILSTLSPLVIEGTELSDDNVAALMAFLHALTDPAALDLTHHIPERSPSGLPIED